MPPPQRSVWSNAGVACNLGADSAGGPGVIARITRKVGRWLPRCLVRATACERRLHFPRAIQDEDLAVHAVLGGNGLRDRLERVDVSASSTDHLANFGRHGGDLHHDRLLTCHPLDPNQLGSINQCCDNSLNKFEDCRLRLLLG